MSVRQKEGLLSSAVCVTSITRCWEKKKAVYALYLCMCEHVSTHAYTILYPLSFQKREDSERGCRLNTDVSSMLQY